MEDGRSLIAIGLATYKRPAMLREALSSLMHLEIPEGIDVNLILCENSSDGSSKNLVKDVQADLNMEVTYVQEVNKGIVHARNRILEESYKLNADFLAFFDDDEKVTSQWLVANFQCLRDHKAQVVQGNVEPVFPENESLGNFKEFFPSSPKLPTGSTLKEAFTNNVLLDLAFVKPIELNFDSRLNDSGGSDSLFFRQLYAHGARIVFCNEALIYETIPESRANLDWLGYRKYRDGHCGVLLDKLMKRRKAYFGGVFRHLKNYFKFKRLLRKDLSAEKKIHYRFVLLEATGGLHAFLGRKIDYYKRIHGS